MKPIYSAVLLALPLMAFTNIGRAESMLRISCDGDAAGAEVFINDKFKGQCPLDVQVKEGLVNLQVQKALDDLEAKAYSESMQMGDGVVKKIEVKLVPGQLSVEGQKYYEKYMAQVIERRANSGDKDAMYKLFLFYRDHKHKADKKVVDQRDYWLQKAVNAGHPEARHTQFFFIFMGGFPKGQGQARELILQDANAGDGLGMSLLASAYLKGEYGFPVDREQSNYWRRRLLEKTQSDANAGDPDAMQSIAQEYLIGSDFVNQNKEKAMKLFKQSAAIFKERALAGDTRAMWGLAAAMTDENGNPMSAEDWAYWKKMAMETVSKFPDFKELREFVQRNKGRLQ